MSRLSMALGLALIAAPVAHAQETIALTGATVLPGAGAPVESATLIVRDGRVVSVTAGGAVPQGATVVDCAGTVITPGFVSTESPLGLVEIGLEDSTNDHAPEGAGADPVRASFAAVDGYNPLSTLIPAARRWGVTSVVSTPTGGLVSGTSAWFDLAGQTADAAIARETTALHVRLGASVRGARSSTLDRLREVFDDARLYRQRRSSFDRRGLRELSVSRLDLERVGQVLAGDLPLVVRASRSSDILRVLAFARDYRIRVVLAGAEEAWMVASQIASAGVTVILQPLTNLPGSFSHLHARYENAALLAAAGVPIVISTSGAHQQRNLRQEAGNAIASGLSREAALRALTVEPARVFGVADQYGSLEPGRVANLVVWTGDPFEISTWARQVFIRGRAVPTTTRQSLLFERYRTLDSVRRGQRGLPRP